MKKSLLKSAHSFCFAWQGILFVLRNENNIRYHILAALFAVIAGFFLKISIDEWIAITICIGIVWVTEFLNSALEKLVDLVSPELNPKAGLVKDIGAGAVLIAAIMAFITGMIILINHL